MAIVFPSPKGLVQYGPAQVVIIDVGTNNTSSPFIVYDSNDVPVFDINGIGDMRATGGFFTADLGNMVITGSDR